MASRQNVLQFKSDEVQGAGSFVKVKRITLDDARAYQNIAQRMDPVPEYEESDEEFDARRIAFTDKKESDARVLLANFILDWDWVDDAGEPLPKPYKNPDVLGRLTDAEFLFILNNMMAPSTEKKKRS